MRRPSRFPRALAFGVLALLAGPVTSARAGVLLPNPDGYWAIPGLPTQLDHAAVVIPERDLLVVIASDGANSSAIWATPLSDGEAWIPLAPFGPPLGKGFVAVYEPRSQRILVHGGEGTVPRTWSLRLDPEVEWSEFLPEEESPGARWDHVAVYDPRHHRVILHGGRNADGLLSDAWELRLLGARPTWAPLKARGMPPGARAGHAAVYDEGGFRMVLFGGGDVEDGSETWELSLRGHPAWRRLPIAKGPGAARTQHTLVADAAHARVLLHGGIDESGVREADTWELRSGDAPEWIQLAPGGNAPRPRSNHVAVFDPERGRMIVSGGSLAQGTANETWALDASASPRWDRLGPAAELPPVATEWMSATMDAVSHRLYVLMTRSPSEVAQTWVRDFAPNPGWSRIFDSPMQFTDLVHDAAGERLVIHGGFSPAPLVGQTNGTWELALPPGSGGGWRPLATGGAGPPPRRSNHVLVHDPRRNRLAVFGGLSVPTPGSSSCAVDVNASLLSLGTVPATWSPITQGPFPEGGWSPVGVCDEAGDRLIVHGGLFACRFPGGHPSGANADGTWGLDLANPNGWTRLTPPEVGPGSVPDAAYDPVVRRMVAAAPGTVAWELPLEPGRETWRQLFVHGASPTITNPCSFDYDAVRDRFVLVSNIGRVSYLLPSRGNALGTIARAASEGDTPPASPGLAASELVALTMGANPSRGALQLTLSVGDDAPARLTLHDVRGRTVASREIAAGTRGAMTLDAPFAAPGVYFVRLQQGDAVHVRKVVLAE